MKTKRAFCLLCALLLLIPALAFCLLAAWTAVPAAATEANPGQGRLYLVSLGAGDRDNVTIRAQKTIASAQVVLAGKHTCQQYADWLQGKEVHEIGHALFKKNCPHRKQDPEGFMKKEAKVRQLVREAVASGKMVAVLDGGDPTIFGPHVGFLTEFKDIDPQIIPGLSSFNAANAALKREINAGIASHSVILTGALDAESATESYDAKDTLAKLSETQSTMVFFTMRAKLPQIVERLKPNYPGDTPVAIVCHAGYRGKEKVIKGTLATILDMVKDQKLPHEHLVYVGDFMR